jgi:Rps23 Pro-64 3,4-dihydroxylase Tpa1-like proline 4-hydroxylase
MFTIEKFNIKELRQQFLNATPFPFIIIDNFLDSEYVKQVENELRNMKEEQWYDRTSNFSHINNEPDTYVQSKKVALNIRQQIPDKSKKVIELFESNEMINFIEQITDITDLQSDYSLLGGGIHRTKTHGRLCIHADFNIHPTLNKHRRINALLYLNSEWCPSYNGELELWSKDMMQCKHIIPPLFNRLVIFKITDDAFHGHPEQWKAPMEYPRMSFAFYYYTDDRPEEEKAPFHWALWQKRGHIDY